MAHSDLGEFSGELEIKFLEKPVGRVHTNERPELDGERDSISCILFESEHSHSITSDFEDWGDVSTIALPPERRNTASRFLNPISTHDFSAFSVTGSELPTPTASERNSIISNAVTDCSSVVISLGSIDLGSPCYGDRSRGNHDPISNVIKPILRGRTKKPEKHKRSESGTLIISGFHNALPDVHDPAKPGFTISRVDTRHDSTTQVEIGEVCNCWTDDDSVNGLVSTLDKGPKIRVDEVYHLRRNSELYPPKEIWMTGGPCPGLYTDVGKVHGRPKWLGKVAKVCWNSEAKAWLLMPKNTKDEDAALAMLCVDSNHPCITTTKWRVAKGSLKGIAYSFYDTYAFKVDQEMSCTKYHGNSENKSDSLLIVDSSLVKIRRGVGIVRFLGPLEDKKGMFAGIELFSPSGLNDGTRKNFFYFEARPKHGIFVRIPGAVKQVFGAVSDQIATFIDDLLVTARTFIDVSEAAVERLIKVIIVLQDWKTLFCKSKLNVLGIILFYELLTR